MEWLIKKKMLWEQTTDPTNSSLALFQAGWRRKQQNRRSACGIGKNDLHPSGIRWDLSRGCCDPPRGLSPGSDSSAPWLMFREDSCKIKVQRRRPRCWGRCCQMLGIKWDVANAVRCYVTKARCKVCKKVLWMQRNRAVRCCGVLEFLWHVGIAQCSVCGGGGAVRCWDCIEDLGEVLEEYWQVKNEVMTWECFKMLVVKCWQCMAMTKQRVM